MIIFRNVTAAVVLAGLLMLLGGEGAVAQDLTYLPQLCVGGVVRGECLCWQGENLLAYARRNPEPAGADCWWIDHGKIYGVSVALEWPSAVPDAQLRLSTNLLFPGFTPPIAQYSCHYVRRLPGDGPTEVSDRILSVSQQEYETCNSEIYAMADIWDAACTSR